MRDACAKPFGWAERGRHALTALEESRYGDREALFRDLGENLGVSAQTLRRDAASVRFLKDTFPAGCDLAHELESTPMAAVEIIARWQRYDAEGALRAADRLTKGELSVRGVEAAEKAARRTADQGERKLRSGNQVFRENVAASLVGIGGKVVPAPIGNNSVPYDFAWAPTARRWIVVIVAGPYTDHSRYNARRADNCLRADWHNRRQDALLILAAPPALDGYREFRDLNELGFSLLASEDGRFELAPDIELQEAFRDGRDTAVTPLG